MPGTRTTRHAKAGLAASALSALLVLLPGNLILEHNLPLFEYDTRLVAALWAAWGLLALALQPGLARSLRGPDPRGRFVRLATSLTVALAVVQVRFDLAAFAPERTAILGAAALAGLLAVLVWRVRPALLVSALTLLSAVVVIEGYRSLRVVGDARGVAASPVRIALPIARPAETGPNVYHFVFDELSLLPLLDEAGRLDSRLVPSLAAFARRATFFPDATSSYSETVYSVASVLRSELILPARDNRHYRSFRNAVRGRSLLRFLEEQGYRIEVYGQHLPYETFLTGLADRIVTGEDLAASAGPWLRFVRIYLSRLFGERPALAASGFIDRRPAVRDEELPVQGAQLLERLTARVAETADGGVYHLVHVLLPHYPFVYAADGALRADRSVMRYEDYLEQIRYLDRLFGRFVAALEARGTFDRSLIVVHSDHGVRYPFPELEMPVPPDLTGESVGLMYAVPESLDLLARVPLLVKVPRQRSGRVAREPATLLDVYPTIADVVGEVPPGLRGVSLLEPGTAPHRALRPFLSSTRRGRKLHRWDEYRVHVRDTKADGWRAMATQEFERVLRPAGFSAPEALSPRR